MSETDAEAQAWHEENERRGESESGYPETPELDRLLAARALTQAAGEFADWLGGQGWSIVKLNERGRAVDHLAPLEAALAEWQGVDQDEVEAERRAILTWLAERQS